MVFQMRVCVCQCVYVCQCVSVCKCVSVCMYVCVLVCVCSRTCMYLFARACVYLCIYASACACANECVCLCKNDVRLILKFQPLMTRYDVTNWHQTASFASSSYLWCHLLTTYDVIYWSGLIWNRQNVERNNRLLVGPLTNGSRRTGEPILVAFDHRDYLDVDAAFARLRFKLTPPGVDLAVGAAHRTRRRGTWTVALARVALLKVVVPDVFIPVGFFWNT